MIITCPACSLGPRIQSPFGDLLIRHCQFIREILDLPLKYVMFCYILLRSPSVVKFFDILGTANFKIFSCKFCIMTYWYGILPLTQDGNYGFMPCTTTVMWTCLLGRKLTFLDVTSKREFKRLTVKTCFFFDSVSLLDSLLHCECNLLTERKTNK